MEKLRRVVNEIAYTSLSPSSNPPNFSPLQRSLIPLLSFSSSLYKLALSLRHRLHRLGLLRCHRLPVPVISVGNLTWGGNGKTPMVEFMALWLAQCGVPPLILTRGYGGGDEASMLRRHLIGTSGKIGVGANRAATAACFLERYGYKVLRGNASSDRLSHEQEVGNLERIGVVILDDGMQHLSLSRDVEITMVNGLMPWGNCQLLPFGPLREPLTALKRADIAVVHHADLAPEQNLIDIELTIQEVKKSLPVFFSRMAPSYFFNVRNINSKIPLRAVCNSVMLCVSAIGFSDAFVQGVEKMGPLYVDRLDFSDHHLFQAKDIEVIRMRLGNLLEKFNTKPIVVVTEKKHANCSFNDWHCGTASAIPFQDYDRDPEILKHLDPFEVIVLCSKLEILSYKGHTEEGFKNTFKKLLKINLT